jgi:hypothetical protein
VPESEEGSWKLPDSPRISLPYKHSYCTDAAREDEYFSEPFPKSRWQKRGSIGFRGADRGMWDGNTQRKHPLRPYRSIDVSFFFFHASEALFERFGYLIQRL